MHLFEASATTGLAQVADLIDDGLMVFGIAMSMPEEAGVQWRSGITVCSTEKPACWSLDGISGGQRPTMARGVISAASSVAHSMK